jgi:phage-related holin
MRALRITGTLALFVFATVAGGFSILLTLAIIRTLTTVLVEWIVGR